MDKMSIFEDKEVMDIKLAVHNLFTRLERIFLPHIEKFLESGEASCSINKYRGLRSPDKGEMMTDSVKDYMELTISAEDRRNEEESLSFWLRVFFTEDAAHVDVPSIHIPEHLRNQGIFSSVISEVAMFMEARDLGNLVGLKDSNEDTIPSMVLNKFGLEADPFIEDRYDLTKSRTSWEYLYDTMGKDHGYEKLIDKRTGNEFELVDSNTQYGNVINIEIKLEDLPTQYISFTMERVSLIALGHGYIEVTHNGKTYKLCQKVEDYEI